MCEAPSRYATEYMRCHRDDVYSHHIVEDEAGVGELEVLQQAVKPPAVQGAPGAVEVVPGLSLLPRVVVVQELNGGHMHYNRELQGVSAILLTVVFE